MTTLSELNSCDVPTFAERLHGIYEHSPWIPQRAAALRPFASVTALKQALQAEVAKATQEEQLGLIRAHPELAGKAAIAGELTAESTSEQAKSGLNLCSAEEFATLHTLNADYNAKFGFPFILAVKGPTGNGLTRQQIIATFTRRFRNQASDEQQECLRQIHRIAEMRINDLLGVKMDFGPAIMQWSEELAQWSDDADGLTCAYMTEAHLKSAAQLADWMREAGMEAHIDEVGNVVGRYLSGAANARTLMTGSHYDTVRNGGKYDGRLGILLPIAIVKHLHATGEKLPFDFEIVGFAEEEGVRFRSTFLGSNAITGRFDMNLLEQLDADGVSMRTALAGAGHNVSAIPQIARDPAKLLAFVEVHIEQGPVLLQRGLPLGVVAVLQGRAQAHIAGGIQVCSGRIQPGAGVVAQHTGHANQIHTYRAQALQPLAQHLACQAGIDQARPALVVATADAPRLSIRRALPASQALARRSSCGPWCRWRKAVAGAVM
eukprot:gene32067-39611_t